MQFNKYIKKVISVSLAILMGFGISLGEPASVRADPSVDFPDLYPAHKLENIDDEAIKVKVDALIKSMTRDEMYSLLTYAPDSSNTKIGVGAGVVNGVPRLGVPVIRTWDGPKGLVSTNDLESTSPASELALASSFSKDLAYKYGELYGSEVKATAGNVALGVQIDHARAPFFFRARDTLGEDPYLTGVLGSEYAAGVESNNVIATLKHMGAYSSMFHNPILSLYGNQTTQDDIIIDEQTLHESYLAQFLKVIKDGNASAIMSSYNKVNGIPAAANEYMLRDVLREMWGFKGISMPDWGAGMDIGQVFVHKGTDLEMNLNLLYNMPIGRYNTKTNIEAAIMDGEMTWADVETAVTHILTSLGKSGYLGLVVVNEDGTAAVDPTPPDVIELPNLEGSARSALLQENNDIALKIALEGAVLLKNSNNALPVSKDNTIAMIGLTGQYTLTGHYAESAFGWLQAMTSPYENMVNLLGKDKITAAIGLEIVGQNIPDEYLFVSDGSQSPAVNGVTQAVYGGDTIVIPNLELTTGTINGSVNKTYKNSADGTALTKGTSVTLTTYLEAPETGTYGFNLQGIGGTLDAKITVDGEDKEIPFRAASVTGVQDAHTAWATGSLVPTLEGMNISVSTLSVDLEAGNKYEIVIKAAADSDSKDQQLRLNWFKPGHIEAERAAAIDAAKNNNKVIVFVSDLGNGDQPSSGILKLQRSTLDLDAEQLSLLKDVVRAAKSKGNQVIVVTNTALPITMDWIEDVDAVLNMWLPGQQGGKATAQLLTGIANPSGKLPISYPKTKNDTQFGAVENSYQNPIEVNKVNEGIFSGYRWYDKQGIDPLFTFGHGLSYTTFAYSDLLVTKTAGATYGYDVTFTVINSGSVAGSEVAQVYLGEAAVPSGIQMANNQLAGFVRIEDLQPGESRTVNVTIDRQSLSYWDKDCDLQTREDGTKDKYVVAMGSRDIRVGSALDDIRLSQQITVGGQEPVNPNGSGNVTSTINTGSTMKEPAPATAGNTPTAKDKLSVTFTDAASIPGWAEAAIADLVNKKIIAGRPNGSFDPQGRITRAEIVKLIVTGLEFKAAGNTKKFNDVNDGIWYKPFIGIAASNGIVNGVGNQLFKPNDSVSRQDICVMVYNALEAMNVPMPQGEQSAFEDDDKITGYAKEAVTVLRALSIINGRTNRYFDPTATATRAEASVIVKGVLDYVAESKL